MRLIVADTSPLVYLVLIDYIHILPQLFDAILVPDAVQRRTPAPAGAAARPGLEIMDKLLDQTGRP
jgi:predicted nucleic acid-binding protein